MVLHLAGEDDPDEFVARDCDDVYVGPPVLEWSIADGQSDTTRQHFYELCKSHLSVLREAIKTRRIGRSPYIVWETNQQPRTVGWKTACSLPAGDQIEPVADLMMPYMPKMLEECVCARDARWLKTLKKLVDSYLDLIETLQATPAPEAAQQGVAANRQAPSPSDQSETAAELPPVGRTTDC